MKKIISLILAAVMLLALGVSALATEILPDSDMTVLQVTVRKHWYDNDEKAHHDDVLADIYVDGKLVRTVTLGENNNWEAVAELSVDPIPVGEKSNFIDNKVKIVERSIAGYKSEVYGPYEVGFYGNRGEIAYDITNSKMVRIEIPVSVTVKQTGNVAPGMHTFYYDFLMNYNKPEMSDLNGGDGAEAEDMPKYTVSYTGALKADGNGFSVMTKGEGTYSGTIVVEATQNVLGHLMGSASRRGSSAIPGCWTYDETVYGVIPGFESEEGGVILGTSYMLFKLEGQAPGAMVPIEGKTMAFVNEYKENRVTTGTDTIKIPAAPAKAEANPNTGAPAQIAYAAVIALGTAAAALKVRK